MINEDNFDFWQSIQMEEHSCLVSALLMRPEFQSVLAQAQDVSKYYLIKRILVNEQLDFVALEFSQLRLVLAQYPELTSILQDDELKLVRIDIIGESAADNSYMPSILASENNLRLKSINRPPSEKVVKVLSQSKKVLTISDQTQILRDLGLLNEFRDKSRSANDLPISLLQFVIRPRYPTKPVQKAVLNNKEVRVEDRYCCNTACIIICKETKTSYVGKTLNLSSKGLAVKLSEDQVVRLKDEVLVSLPGVCKRMGQSVKNQPYQVIEVIGDMVRLKVSGTTKQHPGYQLMQAFLNRYYHQLKTSGIEEDIAGLAQSLRSSSCAYHTSIPFTFVTDKRSSFIKQVCLNEHSKVTNLDAANYDEDLLNLVSSQVFADSIKSLYMKVLETGQDVTGYLLLLPRIKTRSGIEHQYWLQDLGELAKKQTGFEFIEKLHKIGKPSVLSVRLCQPKKVVGKYFIDELNHLKRIDPAAAESIEMSQDALAAFGEIQEVTDLFYLERPQSDEEMLIEIDETTH